jgi:hypothetical protein
MPDTLGSIKAEVLGWMRGDYGTSDDQPLVNSAINDAVEDIWNSMIQVQLARFFGLDSPVSFTLAAGLERTQLVLIPDPVSAPVGVAVAGGALGNRTYALAYTNVTESGAETLPSPIQNLVIGANNLASVPAPAAVANAVGWNLYASVSNTPALLGLQNQQPLPFNLPFVEIVQGWVDYPGAQQQPGAVQSASVATPGSVGVPSENTTADNIAWITHMEVRTSDTLLRSWNQYDIDSELFRRYGRELSSASEYQTYVWDLINGNRLEVRPSAGLTFIPRYFYIARPRRLRYDQGVIPYTGITGVHEFVVDKAIGKLKLGIDEYMSAQAWDAAAAQIRGQIIAGLTQEMWSKNMRVAPHLF